MIWAWAMVPRWIKRGVAWLAAGMALLLGARLSGRRSANADNKLRDLEQRLNAETTRREIDDDIQQDADLAARARRSGLVRPPERK